MSLPCGASLTLLAALLFGVAALLPARGPRLHSGLVGGGGLMLFLAGLSRLTAGGWSGELPRPLGFGEVPLAFCFDPLAGWFLALIGLVAAASAAYLPGYLAHLTGHGKTPTFWPMLGVLLTSMPAVVLAGNAPTFLAAWEVMSLSSFALVATDSKQAGVRQAALVYLSATRVGTACLIGGFLWAHALTGSWSFADWRLTGTEALGPGLLLLVGLGVKAGMWPFHLWLPIAHPVAPAPVSALMSGVMVKVAIYAMVRFFVLPGGLAHPALGWTILTLGAISGFWGVLFALLQRDLKRLLAYSTVENVGLILMAVGLAMVSRLDSGALARIALAAGLLHALNHALFKSLLFLGAGAVDSACGTRDLERLGGLGRRMPVTFACFVLGCAAICALPPLNGFAGEWLLYQGLLGLASSGGDAGVRFLAMLLLAWLALIGALALGCFVKACGVAFLGRPRTPAASEAREASSGMRRAQVLLAACCLALGLVAPWVLEGLQPVVAPLAPGAGEPAETWALPWPTLLVLLGATLAGGLLWLRAAAERQPVRRYITWECGFGELDERMQATATSFAQPVLRLFGALLRYAITRRLEGDRGELFPRRITVEPSSEAILEQRFYRPLLAWISRASARLARLQTGSMHGYLLTMLLVLLILLAVGRVAP